jgi:hypothetical protein
MSGSTCWSLHVSGWLPWRGKSEVVGCERKLLAAHDKERVDLDFGGGGR